MDIVVIDNIHWANEGAGLPDPRPEYLVTSEKSYEGVIKDLGDFSDVYGASGDLVYLINVHCVFSGGDANKKEKSYYSEQNGVRIYRHLLEHYEKYQHNLKVAFFSPIPKEYLTKLHQENVVLEHHLVFQTPFSWEGVIPQIQEWDRSHQWKAFNNASENLLSGWALSGRAKITTNGRQFVFVDDQCNEWETAIKEIVDDPKAFYFANYYKEREPLGCFSPDKLYDPKRGDSGLFKTKLHQSDLVISDFYLQENHEINTWKSYEDLAGISGYKLFQYIRNDLKIGAPIVMHTSSNKVRYYKFLDGKGIDDWISKDVRPSPSNTEKQFGFQITKKTIERFTIGKHSDAYEQLKGFWKRIGKLESRAEENWWFTNSGIGCDRLDGLKKVSRREKSILIEILTDSYFAIRSYLRREDVFAEPAMIRDNSLLASSIVVGLGKIIELLGISRPSTEANQFHQFLKEMRNKAAHYYGLKQFSITDALLYFEYWMFALAADAHDAKDMFGYGRRHIPIAWEMDTDFHLIYLWIQFYNSPDRPMREDDSANARLLARIKSILETVNHHDLYEELSSEDGFFFKIRDRVMVPSKFVDHFQVVVVNGQVKLKGETS